MNKLLIALTIISSTVVAQCSTLSVSGSVNPGQTVTLAVTGAPAGAATVVGIGFPGTTSIGFGGTSLLTISLAPGFLVLPMGLTDASGSVSLSAAIPANVPASMIPNATFTCQALSVVLPSLPTTPSGPPSIPSLTFCLSNTATLVSGTG